MSELKRKLRTFFGMDSLPTLTKSTELAKPPSKNSQEGMDTFRPYPHSLKRSQDSSCKRPRKCQWKQHNHMSATYEATMSTVDSPLLSSAMNVKRILRGAARRYGKKPIRERLEITKEILQAILLRLDRTHDDINLRAAYCTAFVAFLRMGEFTWKAWDDQSHIQYLSRSSVQFVHDGVLLQLPASKTDPFRKGIVIPLSRL